METIFIVLLALLLLVSIITLIFVWKAAAARNNTDYMAMKYKMENLLNEIVRIEKAVKQEMVTNRQETKRDLLILLTPHIVDPGQDSGR